jgi:hypothetical protein
MNHSLRPILFGLVLFLALGTWLAPGHAQHFPQGGTLSSAPTPPSRSSNQNGGRPQQLQESARVKQEGNAAPEASSSSFEHVSQEDNGVRSDVAAADASIPPGGSFTFDGDPHAQSAGLVINATFDSSIINSANAAAIEAMINQAIGIFQSQFSDPVTVSILFRYSTTLPNGNPLPAGALATSNTGGYFVPWTTFINALKADGKTANDAAANASLPASSLSTNIVFSSANGRAVGLNTPTALFADGHEAAGGPYDGIVTLNSNQSLQFNRGGGIGAGNYDAQRTTEHEIDEVLGLGSSINRSSDLRPQDLFSWSSAGTRNMTSSGSRYFSINGGVTDIVGFNQNAAGDFGDWLSGNCPQTTPYVQNAFSCTGQMSDVTATSPEGINLDVIGYDLVQTCSGTKAAMLTPADGSTFNSSTVTFTWSSGTGAVAYWLYVGNSPGAQDIYSASQGTSLSGTVSGIPTDGRTIYVTLWSFICGSWQSNAYTYHAANIGCTKAVMLSPANGSTFSSSTVTFTWSSGTGAVAYWLYVGNSPGAQDIYSAGQGTSLFGTVSGIPTDGRTIYATLWSFICGSWQSNAYTYHAANIGCTKAVMLSPANGSTFNSSTVTFTWSSGTGAVAYWLYVGSSPGAQDIYSAGQGTSLSGTVSGIPTDGRTIYVTLWSFICGSWQGNAYTYQAFSGGCTGTKAVMLSPANGSTFTSTTVAFTWSTGSNVAAYWLYIGNSPGAQDLYSAGQGTNTSLTLTGFPTDGRAIYVTLWSYICGVWQSNAYTYHAVSGGCTGTKAVMLSPPDGSTLTSATVTFTWSSGSNVAQYWLYIGNSPGGQDLYSASQGTNTSATLTGFPRDGRRVYVTLWSYICGVWQSNSYSYTSS